METLDLALTLAGVIVTTLLVIALLLLMRAICHAKWVITLQVPMSTTSTISSNQEPKAIVTLSQEPVDIVKKPVKAAKTPAPITKAKTYPKCDGCQNEIKSGPIRSVLSEDSASNVYKCRKCGKEVQITKLISD